MFAEQGHGIRFAHVTDMAGLQNDEGHDSLPGGFIGGTHDGGFGHHQVRDQRGLNLGGGQTVARDVHDVIDATQQPDVTVVVVAGAITGKVFVAELVPIRFLEALGVAPDSAQHGGPGLGNNEESTRVVGLNDTVFVDDLEVDAGNGNLRASGFQRRDAGEGRDHDRAGLGLPPGVHDRRFAAPNTVVVPDPGLGVNGLAHRTQHTDAGEVELLRNLTAELHERTDGGGRRVQNGDLVLLDQFPPATGVRAVGGSFKEQLRGAIGERRVDHVGVAGDPADVGGAPVDIRFRMQVEDILVGEGTLGQITTAGMQDALGLSRGATGVQNEEGMLGREAQSLVLGVDAGELFVPPDVAVGLPHNVVVAALDDQHVLDGAGGAISVRVCG